MRLRDHTTDLLDGMFPSKGLNFAGLERLDTDREPRNPACRYRAKSRVTYQLRVDLDRYLRRPRETVAQAPEQIRHRLGIIRVGRAPTQIDRRSGFISVTIEFGVERVEIMPRSASRAAAISQSRSTGKDMDKTEGGRKCPTFHLGTELVASGVERCLAQVCAPSALGGEEFRSVIRSAVVG